MGTTLQDQVATDPKWKTFMAAFNKAPSDELLDGRAGDVSDAISQARGLVAGFAIGDLKTKYGAAINTLEKELKAASKLPPSERFAKLDTLGRTAEALKARCEKDGKDSKNIVPAKNRDTINAVESLLVTANGIQQPALKASLQTLLTPVATSYENAKGKKTAREFYKAVDAIDIQALQAKVFAVDQVDRLIKMVGSRLDGCATLLDAIPKDARDEAHAQAAKQLVDYRGELDLLAKSTEVDGLQPKVKALQVKAAKFNDVCTKLALANPPQGQDTPPLPDPAIAERDELRTAVEAVQKQAKTVLDTFKAPYLKTLLATLQTESDKLDQAKLAALAKATPAEQRDALKALATTPVVAATTQVQDALGGVPRMIGGVDDLLATMKDTNAQAALGKEVTKLKAEFEQIMLTEGAKGLDKIKAKLIAITKDVAKVTKQDETTLLLQTQFGVSVERFGKKFKPNVKGLYEALEMVPDSHVGQDKLQKVVLDYSTVMPGGFYSDSAIVMQSKLIDFPKLVRPAYMIKYGEKPFTVDGKEYKPNHFKITMLHEIGHSVDDKHNIFTPLQGASGFGQWNTETAASVIDACTNDIVAKLKVTDQKKKDAIKACVQASVQGEAPKKKPDDLGDEWKGVEAWCKTIALSRDSKEPWYKPQKAINIGPRVYHESYSGDWVSYAAADRTAGSTVSSYQWRAPGEWFATIYSVAWMKKKRPAFLKGKLDEWMPPDE
jgi:hypothetical protein